MPSSVVTLRKEKLRQPASQCRSSIRAIRIDGLLPSEMQPFGDFLEHHLGGAAADRVDAGVAHHSLDGAFADIAETAMELLAVIHHLVDQLAAIGLDHRDLAHAFLAAR